MMYVVSYKFVYLTKFLVFVGCVSHTSINVYEIKFNGFFIMFKHKIFISLMFNEIKH